MLDVPGPDVRGDGLGRPLLVERQLGEVPDDLLVPLLIRQGVPFKESIIRVNFSSEPTAEGKTGTVDGHTVRV
ncbi:hypothetical protein GCM10029978_089070 [Actinoallomurus acanthiterrae]